MKAEEQPLSWRIGRHSLTTAHPSKVYWPKEGYTKLDLLTYYRDMAATLIPYFANRPVTIRFFPRGIEDISFYRRDFGGVELPGMRTETYVEVNQDKTLEVLLITHQIGLLEWVSRGGLEFHLWSATVPNFAKPDLVIFDLDTHSILDFEKVLYTALQLRNLLAAKGLKSYPKTSGGTGLHVYVPVDAENEYLPVRNWVMEIGKELTRQFPKIIAMPSKGSGTHQKGKVTIDIMQNVISRNTIAPYSARAVPGAPVSAPLRWEEIEKDDFLPKDFNITTMKDRVLEQGDLFSEVLSNKQELVL